MKVLIPNPIPTEVQPFARASTATYIDSAGVLQTAGVNVPRFQGGAVLVEGAGTNLVANNTMLGASVGSPGVLPTGWNSAVSSGISRSVVGVGVELGVSYVDIRFSGTNSSGSVGIASILFGGSSGAVPAVLGSSWTPSVYLKIAGGSLENLSLAAVAFYEKTSAMGFVRTANGPVVTVTSSLQRFASPAVAQGAATAFVDSPQVYFSMGVGASVDLTLRVGLPQFESGPAATSVIPTTTAPATRAADIVASSGIVASNTVEAYPTWAAGTTYAKDARVDYGINIYQSLVNSNTGNQPDISQIEWALVGPDNKHAMFDNEIGTVTTSPAPLSVTVATGVMDAVYLGNVTAARATVTVQNGAGGPVVYQSTQSLAGDEVADWYQYFFFDPLTQRTQAFFQGIPLVLNSYLTIELEGSGTVSIGTVSFGRLRTLGTVGMGAQAGIRDYSRKETDEFGVTTFVQRAYSKRLSAQFAVDRAQLNRVQRQLYDLRSTPVVWLGADDAPEYEEALTIFGFYRDFTTAIDYPTYSLCNIEIEGLI